MQRLQMRAHLRAQHLFHQLRLAPHHMHFDVASTQRRRHLQADKAGANHHGTLCLLGRSGQRLTVGLRAQGVHMRQIGAGNSEPHRLGARRQQQGAISHPAAIGQFQVALRDINACHARTQPHVDVVLSVERLRPQRQPLGRRRTGQVVFGQVGPVARQGRIGAQQRDGAGIAFTAQGFGSGLPGRTTADDHDGRWQAHGGGQLMHGRGHALAGDRRRAIAQLDLPAGNAAQRGRTQGLAGAQAKRCMVPGAAHGFAHQQALRQRPTVMRAGGAYGKNLIAPAHQEHGLAVSVAQQHVVGGNALQGNTLGKVGPRQGGFGFRHGRLLCQTRRPPP